jgi:hypothetical protein
MVFGFRRSRSNAAYYDDPYGELYAGDRIGGPLYRRRGKFVTRGVVLLGLLGAGWAVTNDPTWVGWSFARASAMVRAAQDMMRELSDPPPAIATANKPAARVAPSPPPPSATIGAAVVPGPAREPAEQPLTSSPPPASGDSDEPKDASWQPPRADPGDPLQVRAEAAGLHPELSRALLARLSPDDYRNAGIAIKTAMAETPDEGVFAWPRQRKPELAHFQVRFVAGAAPNCRRYVVVVTKDGWSTTALPMERCGVEPVQARRG